ncbi:MAG: chemotaxis protein CheC [Clostridiales bacterium]|nr:chemotaxis protein CheC [Clostridiales bacterium]
MEIKRYEDMDLIHLDVIREIGSIGTGNAATALSGMLSEEIKMTIPQVYVLGFNEAVQKIGNPEEIVAAVLVEMSGEIEGIMLFILRLDFVNLILEKSLGETIQDFSLLTDMKVSALEEIGNIMISSYINAISTLTGLEIRISVPAISINMVGGILTVPMAELGYDSDKIMMINGKFIIQGKEMNSELLLLPDMHCLNVLMRRLGVEH